MLRRIYAAYRGSRLWAGLQRKYEVDEGLYVVLMPDDDAELNAVALGHLEELVADRRARGVVLVADPSVDLEAARASSPSIVGTECWAGGRIDALLSYYELHNFSDRLLVVSLTKPFGNGLHRLLGRQGVTREDLVCLGCFRLRGYGMAGS
jgi:hypothetical protein